MNSPFQDHPDCPPVFRFLGNGNHSVWINEHGSEGSFSGDILLTCWPDGHDHALDGFRIFLRDQESGKFGIIGQKISAEGRPGAARVKFHWKPGVFSIFHEWEGIQVRLDGCVAPGLAAGIRKVTLTNTSDRPRKLDLTTFAEVVLNRKEAHQAHPVFSKLFLQTEYDPANASLVVNRRPRDLRDIYPLLVHAFLGSGTIEHETSRPRFLGRGRHPLRPAALVSTAPLSGTTGNVLDPIVSLRRSLHLEPGGQEEFAFLLGTAADPRGAADLVDSYGPRTRSPRSSRRLRRTPPASSNGQECSCMKRNIFRIWPARSCSVIPPSSHGTTVSGNPKAWNRIWAGWDCRRTWTGWWSMLKHLKEPPAWS